MKAVRKWSSVGGFTQIEDRDGRLISRLSDGEFATEFQNSDRFNLGVNRDYEYLVQPFPIATGVRIPIGGYEFTTGRIGYQFGQQRRLSGRLLYEQGTFYEGDRRTLTVSQGRINVRSQFSVEPTLSLNWVNLPFGDFTTTVVSTRTTYTIRPLMFVSALIQYNSNSSAISGNIRLRWEYRPGSELFIVYNEERGTMTQALPGLRSRALVLKVNRLFRP